MNTGVVTFQGWEGGERGHMPLRRALQGRGDRFHARNLYRSSRGMLVPRPGLKKIALTGMPNGVVRGIGLTAAPAAVSGTKVVLIVGNTVVNCPLAGGAVTTQGVIPGSITYPIKLIGGYTFSVAPVYGNGTYWLDHEAGTVTNLATSGSAPAAKTGAFFNDRLYLADTSSARNRIYYSEPSLSGWRNWPALNFFDVGGGLPITYMEDFKGRLLIAKQDPSWWMFGGTPGAASATLRRVSDMPAPNDPYRAVRLNSGRIAFLPRFMAYPSFFNGAVGDEMEHLRFVEREYADDSGDNMRFSVVNQRMPDEALFLANKNFAEGGVASDPENAVILREGAFSYLKWAIADLSAYAVTADNDQTVIATNGAAGTAPELYLFHSTLDRPARVADTTAAPNDNGTDFECYLECPEYWAEQGEELRVRSVMVEVERFQNGTGTPLEVECRVDALSVYGGTTESNASAVQSKTWVDQDYGAGSDARAVFNFGDQGKGVGFRVVLPTVYSVNIRSVTVEFDVFERVGS